MRACHAGKLGTLFLISALAGCRPYPSRPVVSKVELESDGVVETGPIVDGLATAASPRLFEVIPRVLEYEIYDPTVLARDLERVERAYRARGYYEAKVTAARVIHLDEHHVRVELRVHEGEPVRVAQADAPGLGSLPLDAYAATREAVSGKKLITGAIFDEAEFEADKERILRALRSSGFAFAKVEGKARVDIAQHAAYVTYRVDPGPRALYGPIQIIGLKEIPEGQVRDVLGIQEGGSYSIRELEEAELALSNLGVFSRVEVRPDTSRPESRRVPLQVVVEESKLRTVRLGGGTRLDTIRLSFHARAGWEDRNFLGGMRTLGIEARPGVTLFPTSIQRLERPVKLLGEYKLSTHLTQPSFFEARTTGFLAASYQLYPVLYPLPPEVDATREQILGYHQVSARGGIERWFPGAAPPITQSHQVLLRPSYNWQANFPIFYQGKTPVDENGDAVLQKVLVSFPEFESVFEAVLIENKLDIVFANSLQVAGFIFGGTVSDAKLQPELRTFIRNFFGRGTTLATRLSFGFLFPADYGETLDRRLVVNNPPDSTSPTDPTNPDVIRDQQKLLLRAFYSGGPSSNRGYPYRGVGPHGPVGFLIPGANPANCERTPEACIRPLGGLTLWEASLEARFPIQGDLGGVVFVDASDLRRTHTVRLDRPHLSPGLGLRYNTPVGPLRLDLAYRVPYLQKVGEREVGDEGGSPSGAAEDNFLNQYWAPFMLHFAIGEAI
jgi:acetolactate synthase regulatory subunit